MSELVDEPMIPPDKRARNDNIEENQDRLSDLPDCVLLHILSFLNSKYAVQTCVLSTRWKYLWKLIPTLILYSSQFSMAKHFTYFVSKILTLRDSSTPIHALDVERKGVIGIKLLQMILDYIRSHNTHIRRLGINVAADSCPILSCISKCQALTSLKLSVYHRPIGKSNNYTVSLFPKSLNLPLLTNLELTNFTFCGGENGCAEPFSAFTKLNSLVIYGSKLKDAQILTISSETLVNFAMHDNSPNIDKIDLSAPSLCTFTFTGEPVQRLCGSSLSSIKQVNIKAPEYSAWMKFALVLLSWLQDLVNVESLTVTSTTLQVLSLVPDLSEVKFSSLCNLKLLEIQLQYESTFRTMKYAMLKKAAAKSQKEIDVLAQAFKAGWEPPPIPDGIVDFLRQNSPTAEVNITTKDTSYFNMKQVVESIKGANKTNYRLQFAMPASTSAAPASASAPASVAAPASTSAAPTSAAESASAAAPAPTSDVVPASAAPNLHLCCAEKAEYERQILDRDSQETPGDDLSGHESDNILDVVEGVDKEGNKYGLGPEAGKHKPSVSSTSFDGISPSTSEYEHMRAAISKLSAENMTLREQLKTHEELIRASQEELKTHGELIRASQEESRLLRKQFQQFLESFSLGHPPPPPPCSDSLPPPPI